MSLPLTHAGGSVDGISAALDLRFASSLSLTSTSGITPSFSRASTGTFFNSSGVLTTAAINAPRFDYVYDGTNWISKGLLIEEARTNSCLNSNTFSSWNPNDISISASAGVSPSGDNDAWKIYPLQSGGSVQSSSSVGFTFTNHAWTFSLADGAVGSNIVGTSTPSISSVGNGWYRIAIAVSGYTFSAYAKSAGRNFVLLQLNNVHAYIYPYETISSSGTPSGTNGILIYGAQVENGSFPTSYIPTTTAAVTRSADVCQITGGDFSGFWNASEGSFVTEADSIGFASTGSDRYIIAFNSSGTANIAHAIFLPTTGLSFDVYNSTLQARVSYTQPNAGDSFKLASCYKANDFAATLNGSAVQTDTSGTVPTINNVGIGHYPSFNQYANCHIARLRYFNKRLTNKQLEDLCKPEQQLKLDLNFSSSLSLTPTVGPTPSYSRASTGTYFNSSGVLTSAAINAPRFDHVYDGTNWVSKGLLVEEQRTNSVTKSNTFSAWSKNDAVVTSDSTTAPDGTANGDLVTFTASGAGLSRVIQISGFSNISGTTYTKSIFVKSGTQRYFQIVFGSPFSSKFANFDTQDKVAATVSAGITTSVIDCGNGWFRYSASVAATVTSSADQFWIYAVDSGTATWAPSSSTGGTMWLFGAQYETGAFATSFIASDSGTAVTRSADVCQITGTDFSSFWNANEGSVAAEWDRIFNETSGEKNAVWFAQNSSSPGSITMGHELYNGSEYFLSQADVALSATAVAAQTLGKSAVGYKLNNFGFSVNGAAVLTDTSSTVPTTVNRLVFGNQGGYSVYLNGHIARLRYYAIRLPNRLLIAKST